MEQGMDDVKVCDICGDIGEEEKLAICSRCNDGAEHIYCMQTMIKDVPEGDWFCEECRGDVDIEERYKKLEMSQVKADTVSSKNKAGIEHVSVTYGRIKKRIELKNCGICGDVGEQEKLAVCSRCNDGAEHIYCMRVMMEEVPNVGWLCEACQSEVEAEKKTNELQKPQVKNDILKNSQGQLSKSDSFNNSKILKVKTLGYEYHLRPKLLKESSLCITKKVVPTITPATSTSFRKSNIGDPAPKDRPPKKLPAEVSRVMNQPDISSIAYPFVSAPMIATVASQAESTEQYELKKPLLVDAPGSIMLSRSKRSAGFLGPDPKRTAVQVLHHSHQDYTNSRYRMLKVKGYDTPCIIGTTLDSPTISSDLGDKTQVFCNQDYSPDCKQIASAIPAMDYVWQGSFELWGTGSLPEFCDGLQGHVSCSVSPELLEQAMNFPSKLQLQELPRQSVWPLEFEENCPTCDSIDIFFFARDTQSYEYYYSKLLENITKDDLALRGNTETAELIIFSSDTLPENIQRWNMLYFLWGVLRVNRDDVLNLPPGLPDHYR